MELSPVEALIAGHLEAGTRLDCIPGIPAGERVPEETMRAWGPAQVVSSDFLRRLMRGLVVAAPDPHGIHIRGLRICGRLDLEDLDTRIGIVLLDCLLEEGLTSRDARLPVLRLSGCRVDHPDASVIDATRMVTSGPVAVDNCVIGASARTPAVEFSGASIGGQLKLTGSTITNGRGPVLGLDDATVTGDVILQKEFRACGAGDEAMIRARDAHIGARFDCSGIHVVSEGGPILDAASLRVDKDLFLRGMHVCARSRLAAITLSGASVGGRLDCTGMHVTNSAGGALDGKHLTVATDMLLCDGVHLEGAGDEPVVRLDDTHVTGVFTCSGTTVVHAAGPRYSWSVDGLTYAGTPEGLTCPDWLALFRERTPHYAAQPYQQLAAAHRAKGQESDVRRILMAQREAQLAADGVDARARLWGGITHVTLGYGYQPWRALICLLVTLVISVTANFWLGAHGALTRVPDDVAGQPCSVLERVGVGVDASVPLIKTGARDRCDLTTDAGSTTGTVLTISTWIVQLAAWGFAALFVAGFTGAVRKT